MCDDDALEVIRQAERIVWAAGWHMQEQDVLQQLAGRGAWPAPAWNHAPTSSSSSATTASTSGRAAGRATRPGGAMGGRAEHQARVVGTYGSAGNRRRRARPGLRQDDQENGLKCLRDTTSRGLPG